MCKFKQKQQQENPLYKSAVFDGLKQSLESAIQKTEYQSVAEIDVGKLPSLLAKKLVDAMLKKGLLNSKGVVIRDFEANYLAEIVPYFSNIELKLLEMSRPDEFASKFFVHPQAKKETSLVCYLKNQEDSYLTSFTLGQEWMDEKRPLFESFSFPIEGYESSAEFDEAFYRSPFEMFSRNKIVDILDEILDENY